MLLSNLELLATAPGGVARLRELILTLAVQGKLVPQDPADEPASVLLRKIRAEKDRLLAEGKIKKDKPLAAVADEEKPFELPMGWEWVRLNNLTPWGLIDGDWIESKDQDPNGLIRLVQLADIGDGFFKDKSDKYINQETFEGLSCSQIVSGDVLIARLPNPIGRSCVFPGLLNKSITVVDVAICRLSGLISNDYLVNAINSGFVRERIESFGKGATRFRVSTGNLKSLLLPLPPLAEQSRIVARVEALMRLCDALEAKGQLEATQHAQLLSTLLGTLTASATPDELADNWQRVAQHFDLLLDRPEAIDALEQTLLQLAVRGLLVAQDPADEPTSVLLRKIRAEKDRLIAAGQIKRDKPLPPITDEEKPFELPVGWEWARFPELGQFGRGKSKHRPRNDPSLFNPPIYPVVQTGEVARAKGVIQEYHSKYSELGLAQSRLWPKGTLCITIAANIADAAVLGFDACFPDSVVGFIPADAIGEASYFLAFMETARTQLVAFAPATAQKNINLEILESVLIPIPPLAEMTRIVACVTQLRRLCTDLRQRLAEREVVQARLAEALAQSVA